ncbi:MAG: hypothetical protein NE327_08635 [Lentisphaeraceae bacterium]|nr:hypothetical protein [Lentisphaeraceae bacterium]
MGLPILRECENMRFEISYVEDGNYLLVEITGGANLDLLKEMVSKAMEHPSWHSSIPALVDFRGFSAKGLSSDDVYELSELCKSLRGVLGDGGCALVMSKELDFGLARMWQMMTESHVDMEIEIFKDIDEAKEWLTAN